MEWKGPIKEIQVELPGDLHKAVRSKALTEDLRIYQAYTIALEWYLGYTPKVEMPKAFRDLDPEDLAFIQGLSRMHRDAKISATRRGLIDLLRKEVADYLAEEGDTAI